MSCFALYDPTNQLTSATYSTASGGHQPANESYSYTANGNRNSTGYTTGSPNLMMSDGTFDYQYDADGNRASRTQIAATYSADYRTTYTWDYRNRLTDVQFYDNDGVLTKHVHFVYDVLNQLIGEEDDDTGSGTYNQEQWYVVEGGQPALVFNGSGALVERNLLAPNAAGVDAVMAQGAVTSLAQADVVTWTADDRLGTPRDILSNSGTVLNHVVDNAFGETAYQSDPSVTWWAGFGGGHVDPETGMVQNGHRWYDPNTGKWLSQDPIDFRGRDGDLSRYVGNDPTNAHDPSGEITLGQAGAMAFTPMFLWPMILAAEEQGQAQQQAAADNGAEIQARFQQAQQFNNQFAQAAGHGVNEWGEAIGGLQGGAVAPFPFCMTQIAIATAAMGQAGAPAGAQGANVDGLLGGMAGGALMGGFVGFAGAVGVITFFTFAPLTVPVGGVISFGVWTMLGGTVGGFGAGMIAGANINNFDDAFDAAFWNWTTVGAAAAGAAGGFIKNLPFVAIKGLPEIVSL